MAGKINAIIIINNVIFSEANLASRRMENDAKKSTFNA